MKRPSMLVVSRGRRATGRRRTGNRCEAGAFTVGRPPSPSAVGRSRERQTHRLSSFVRRPDFAPINSPAAARNAFGSAGGPSPWYTCRSAVHSPRTVCFLPSTGDTAHSSVMYRVRPPPAGRTIRAKCASGGRFANGMRTRTAWYAPSRWYVAFKPLPLSRSCSGNFCARSSQAARSLSSPVGPAATSWSPNSRAAEGSSWCANR